MHPKTAACMQHTLHGKLEIFLHTSKRSCSCQCKLRERRRACPASTRMEPFSSAQQALLTREGKNERLKQKHLARMQEQQNLISTCPLRSCTEGTPKALGIPQRWPSPGAAYLHVHASLLQARHRDCGGNGQAARKSWRHRHSDQVQCL
eukprot:752197-Pelagomonas_calceolata.AAC.2